jgi:RNA polymerase sigma-70 factor (ECF subfamily)
VGIPDQQVPEWIAPLIAAARGGDQSAFDELFAACRDYLYAVANQKLTGPVRAKVAPSDLVQETLFQAHQNFARFQGDSREALLAWLVDILDKNAKAAWRSYIGTKMRDLRRETSLDDGSAAAGQACRGDDRDPGAAVVRADEERWLARAMLRLSEVHRDVITFRTFHDQPFAAVAKQLGCTEDQARRLWAQAVDELAKQFKRTDDPKQ